MKSQKIKLAIASGKGGGWQINVNFGLSYAISKKEKYSSGRLRC